MNVHIFETYLLLGTSLFYNIQLATGNEIRMSFMIIFQIIHIQFHVAFI